MIGRRERDDWRPGLPIQAAICAARSLSGVSGVLYHLLSMCYCPYYINDTPSEPLIHNHFLEYCRSVGQPEGLCRSQTGVAVTCTCDWL